MLVRPRCIRQKASAFLTLGLSVPGALTRVYILINRCLHCFCGRYRDCGTLEQFEDRNE